jgi:putative methyltransferase (TIGR04325 family)
MAGSISRAMRLSKYVQPRRYLSRIQAFTASFAQPIEDYEADTLTELVYRKTVALNGVTELDFSLGAERLLLAVGSALMEAEPDRPCLVLDFGGACGAHYKFATLMFPDARFRWAVVETPSMAKKARSLETDSLKFFDGIGPAMQWLDSVTLLNSNSALQYLDDPLQTTRQLLGLTPRVVLWERLMLSGGVTYAARQRSMLFNHGPGAVPPGFRNRPVLNKITRLSRADFLSAHHEAEYRLRCKSEESEFSTYLFSRRTPRAAEKVTH